MLQGVDLSAYAAAIPMGPNSAEWTDLGSPKETKDELTAAS